MYVVKLLGGIGRCRENIWRTVKLLGGGVSAVGCAAVCDVSTVSSSCLVAQGGVERTFGVPVKLLGRGGT